MLIALLMAAAAAVKPAPFAITSGPGGGMVTVSEWRVKPGQSAVVLRLAQGAAYVSEGPDQVTHLPSGVRLPRQVAGCRLAAVVPLYVLKPGESYAKGGQAQYDCSPSDGLTQVEVSFETDFKPLQAGDQVGILMRIADEATKGVAKVDRSICRLSEGSQNPLHAGVVQGQCGIRWTDRTDPNQRTYGVATLVAGRGDTFIRFTRWCVDQQCDASLASFGRFFAAFDLRGLQE